MTTAQSSAAATPHRSLRRRAATPAAFVGVVAIVAMAHELLVLPRASRVLGCARLRAPCASRVRAVRQRAWLRQRRATDCATRLAAAHAPRSSPRASQQPTRLAAAATGGVRVSSGGEAVQAQLGCGGCGVWDTPTLYGCMRLAAGGGRTGAVVKNEGFERVLWHRSAKFSPVA